MTFNSVKVLSPLNLSFYINGIKDKSSLKSWRYFRNENIK